MHLRNLSLSLVRVLLSKEVDDLHVNKYEYIIELLAAMASMNIAKEKNISRTKAFFIHEVASCRYAV